MPLEQLFDLRVHHLDGAVRVELVGELDLASCDSLKDALWTLVARYDADQIELDCSALAFVDVRGAAILVELARATGGGRPKLVDPPALLTTILEVGGDGRWFDLEGSSTSIG